MLRWSNETHPIRKKQRSISTACRLCQAVAAGSVLWFKFSCWCFGARKTTWKDGAEPFSFLLAALSHGAWGFWFASCLTCIRIVKGGHSLTSYHSNFLSLMVSAETLQEMKAVYTPPDFALALRQASQLSAVCAALMYSSCLPIMILGSSSSLTFVCI